MNKIKDKLNDLKSLELDQMEVLERPYRLPISVYEVVSWVFIPESQPEQPQPQPLPQPEPPLPQPEQPHPTLPPQHPYPSRASVRGVALSSWE